MGKEGTLDEFLIWSPAPRWIALLHEPGKAVSCIHTSEIRETKLPYLLQEESSLGNRLLLIAPQSDPEAKSCAE